MGMFLQGHIHHRLNIEILQEKIKGMKPASPKNSAGLRLLP